jgi:putative Ca2+/H+ antiporter (TMEM165/GDT1 family)
MAAFFTVFVSVLLAELGDKTQIATLLFAAEGGRPRWLVFAAASAALAVATGIAVLAGAAAERYLAAAPLKLIAGCGFMAIGALLVVEHFRP